MMFLGIANGNIFAQDTAQTQAAPSQRGLGGMLGQVRSPFGGGRASVTVAMTDPVDSAAGGAANRSYRATVTTGTTVGGVSVPQGSLAILSLQQSGNSWTLAMTSISASGQAIPVSSSVGNAKVGQAASAFQNVMNGGGLSNIWQQKKQQKAQPASNTPPVTVSGARVYVPANSSVTYMVSAVNQPNAQANAAATPVAPNSGPSNPIAPQPVQGFGQPTAQPAGPQAGPQAAGSSVVQFGNIQYQLTGCHREAPHIVCELQITNQGAVDASLLGSDRTYYIDQSGNRGAINSATIANCNLGRCAMLPQIPMKARYIFMDDTGESRNLVRLQISSGPTAVAQFTNIPVQ